MKRNLPAILAKLVKHAPPLIAQDFRPDCCIAATKIALGVLTMLGFYVKVQPTQLIVYTKRLWRRVESNTFDYPFLDGEYSVGVGFDPETGKQGYVGHLVAIVAEPAAAETLFLVDLSLGQANRPKKGINLPPALFSTGNKMKLNGCVLIYRAIENPVYLQSPDWTDRTRTDPIILELLRIIKSENKNRDQSPPEPS